MPPRPSLHDLHQPQPPLDSERVRISNVRVREPAKKGEMYEYVLTFDIGWKDSWRYDDGEKAGNRDAAWIFVKFGPPDMDVKLDSSSKGQEIIAALNEERLEDALTRLVELYGAEANESVAELCRRLLELLDNKTRGRLCSQVIYKNELWEVRFEFTEPGPALVCLFSFDSETGTLTVNNLTQQQCSMFITAWSHTPHEPGAPEAEFLPSGDDSAIGVFLCRKEPTRAPGPVLYKNVRLTLRWPYKVQGLTPYAMEMVRIPEGPFFLGDPTGEEVHASFYDVRKHEAENAEDLTYEVTSEEAEIALGEELGFDRANAYTATLTDFTKLGKIPSGFPKGFNAFYVMKYQVSQGEYAAFINTLSGPARTLRHPFAQGSYRFATQLDANKVRIATRPHRPCNWLSWADGMVYADWAGLRPMTELEFEKACRGFRAPEVGEFAWGTQKPEQARMILGDESQGNACVSGNCNYGETTLVGGDGGQGPVREDAFMSSEGLRRLSHHGGAVSDEEALDPWAASGASYWGVFGLSGNLWEFCVTVAMSEGLRFDGKGGSGGILAGALGVEVDAWVQHWKWPEPEAKGVGFRGGSWFTPKERLYVADRRYAGGIPGYMGRSHDTGFRAVLTDPGYGQKKKEEKKPVS